LNNVLQNETRDPETKKEVAIYLVKSMASVAKEAIVLNVESSNVMSSKSTYRPSYVGKSVSEHSNKQSFNLDKREVIVISDNESGSPNFPILDTWKT
jgi:hypothetical protein